MKANSILALRGGISLLALATGIFAAGTAPAQACDGDSPLIGSVCVMAAFKGCPYGFLQANGQVVSMQNYMALYSLLGTTFGGDGKTTFGLPNLSGRVPVGVGPATSAAWGGNTYNTSQVQFGQYRGAEGVTLAAAQTGLMAHTHPATFTGTGGGGGSPAQASGSVSVPVTVSVPAQNVSVSGNLMIANSTASGTAPAPTPLPSNAVLAKGGGQATIYAPSTTAADTAIGPKQTFSGSTATASATGTAAGTVTLPVTGGGGGITGGTVSVAPAGQSAAMATPTVPPELGLYYCIAWQGLYPNYNN